MSLTPLDLQILNANMERVGAELAHQTQGAETSKAVERKTENEKFYERKKAVEEVTKQDGLVSLKDSKSKEKENEQKQKSGSKMKKENKKDIFEIPKEDNIGRFFDQLE